MHTLQVLTCPSPALNADVPVAVLLPPDHAISDRRYAVLTLLHGLSDTFMCWLDRSNVKRYLDSLRLIVVMPECGRSFYINTVDGRRYEDFLVDDLTAFIDTRFETIASGAARAIGGVSMGGYGALMLALRHTNVWNVAFSHSGAVGAPRWIEDPPGVAVWGAFDSPTRHDHDLWTLIDQGDPPWPQIYFDCGLDDFLVDENRALHRLLNQRGIQHVYRERPGGHSWRYADENLAASIRWTCRRLAGECDPALDEDML